MGTDNKTGMRDTGEGAVIFYITAGARKLAERIAGEYPGAEVVRFSAKTFSRKWGASKYIVCIMAAGIVVRAAAPLLRDKRTDPAVVVMDEAGRYVISLLGGHIGGANELTFNIAGCIGAQPVITTSSDVQGRIALDMWASARNLYVEDHNRLKRLSMKIVNGEKVKMKIDYPYERAGIPVEFKMVNTARAAEAVVSHRLLKKSALFFRPPVLCVGIGCNRGTTKEEIGETVRDVFRKEKLSPHSVRALATIDLKKDESGLLEYAEDNSLDLQFYSKRRLNSASKKFRIRESDAVRAATGAVAVAEPSAILCAIQASGGFELITPKRKRGNVTLAIAKTEYTL